jgi:hypothetical protein
VAKKISVQSTLDNSQAFFCQSSLKGKKEEKKEKKKTEYNISFCANKMKKRIYVLNEAK